MPTIVWMTILALAPAPGADPVGVRAATDGPAAISIEPAGARDRHGVPPGRPAPNLGDDRADADEPDPTDIAAIGPAASIDPAWSTGRIADGIRSRRSPIRSRPPTRPLRC